MLATTLIIIIIAPVVTNRTKINELLLRSFRTVTEEAGVSFP